MSPIQVGNSHTVTNKVTADDIETFMDLAGDHNPIHLDAAYAITSRFEKRIANGWPGAIYFSQTLQFRAPVYVDDTITVNVTTTTARPDKPSATFRTACHNQNTLVLEGEATCLIPN